MNGIFRFSVAPGPFICSLLALCMALAALSAACSPDSASSGVTSENGPNGETGGNGGNSGNGGAEAGGSAAFGGSAGFGGSAANGAVTGGSGPPPVAGSGGSGGPPPASGGTSSGGSGVVYPDDGGEDDFCAAEGRTAENRIQPADIVMVVDQSGSMVLEALFVQEQINGFATIITQAGIDAHVVLIASRTMGNPICVPQPLAGPACADNLPIFLQVDDEVASHDSLIKILQHFATYRDILRPDASKHFVVITDDESEISAAQFDADIRATEPGLFDNYVFHGIYSFQDPITSCLELIAGVPGPCCALSAAPGFIYRELIDQTGGVAGDLCIQDFLPVWDAVAATVIQGSSIACEWDIPEPPEDETFAADMVNVEFSAENGPAEQIGFVETPDDCARVQDGWYYDNNDVPTQILFCPDTCSRIQGHSSARVDIKFGCEREIAIIE